MILSVYSYFNPTVASLILYVSIDEFTLLAPEVSSIGSKVTNLVDRIHWKLNKNI